LVTGRSLTREEHQRIQAALDAVERSTTADLDLVVVRVSDRYPLYPLVWAAIIALVASVVLVVLWPGLGARSLLELQYLILVVLTVVFDTMPLRLKLVPREVKRAHARELAHREFAAQHEPGGAKRKCVLLFVSVGERYVEIIADHETYGAAEREVWDKMVADFVTAVQSGRVADGILAAIESCGVVLRKHHPSRSHMLN
jgi:putative membrane protein